MTQQKIVKSRREGDVNKVTLANETMEMEYLVCKPTRWTFENDKIRNWLLQWLKGDVLNACAGKTKLDYDGTIVRNDINTEIDADYHHDVTELDTVFESRFDTIIFDPPFSDHQADAKYDGQRVDMAAAKREFNKLLRSGGRVIQFGYTTTCMPGRLGYTRDAVVICNTVGPQNDYLGTVDRKVNGDVTTFGGDVE